jgi:uncharacterized membrane protein
MAITNLLEPKMLLLLIPLIFVFGFFIFKAIVHEDPLDRKERKKFRRVIFATRTIILILLVLALAKPYGEITTTTPGNPRMTILVDNSTSMEIMDTDFFPGLRAELEKDFPVNVKIIGRGTNSNLGDEILSYLETDTNVLLITDGNSNTGATLEQVSLLAANLNSTISAITLKPRQDEVGVYITGVDSSVQGVNNTYVVNVVNTKGVDAVLRVLIDEKEVYNGPAKQSHVFQWDFNEGDHRIIAEVSSPRDHFLNNNRFYKLVSTVKKPKILLIQNTPDPVEKIFSDLYDVTKLNYIPDDVNKYYAVIINDMPANIQGVEKLTDYLIDKDGGYYGNGLFVIGGFDSFDRGNYKGSILETYLPVTVGQAERKRGSSNIALAIDLSSSSGSSKQITYRNTSNCRNLSAYTNGAQQIVCETERVETTQTSDQSSINRALAASVINSLGPDNTVGAVIYASRFGVIQELMPLFQIRTDLIDKVSKAEFPKAYDSEKKEYYSIQLNEDISQGLTGAYSLLKDDIGSRNIILISNGGGTAKLFNNELDKRAIDTAKTLNAQGVKIYVVGTGRDATNTNEALLKDIAYNGGGVYFPADRSNNLKILFGDENSEFGKAFDLFVLNPYHFITQDLSLQASLYGFNQVVPKSNAILLVTTQRGEPAVTAWNYGFGRVVTLNVFSGNNNLGDLMNKRNSLLLTRIVNWAIGDPQRKEPYYVVIENARLGTEAEIIIKSEKYPNVEGLSLTKIGENQYRAIVNAEEVGFNQAIGKTFAVNYEEEYQRLGMNPNLPAIVRSSGGKIFEPSDKEPISDFIKTVSKRTKIEKTTIVWPFIIAAVIVFMIEILIRRIREYRLNR